MQEHIGKAREDLSPADKILILNKREKKTIFPSMSSILISRAKHCRT